MANVPAGLPRSGGRRRREGFISGLNEILMLGGIMSLAGGVAALWLVRERDIERERAGRDELPHLGEAVPEPVSA